MWILQRLALLVVCHGLTVGQIMSQYFIVQRPISWSKAREFCQKHFVDLAVLNKQEQYFTLLNATSTKRASFWIGLQRQSIASGWKWVDEEDLSYDLWYRNNYEGHCASLEAMLKTIKKLLARYCDELHKFVCQGPVAPQPVTVDLVGSDHVTLTWNVSTFMQITPHSYNVTICSNRCDSLIYNYTDGMDPFMNINISNLTSATEYLIEISSLVIRHDGDPGGTIILQSDSTALLVKTVESGEHNLVKICTKLKLLKLVCLVLPLCILYRILKKDTSVFHNAQEVRPHSMPFMALLVGKKSMCGGILISPDWVLTVAHCSDVERVLLGVHSIKSTRKEKNSRQVLKVKKQIPHPLYDKRSCGNDLMLLKLSKPAQKTKTVEWLKLGKTIKDPAVGSTCRVAGWGAKKNFFFFKKMSDVLMAANVTVVDRVKCNPPDHCNSRPVITKDRICARSDVKNTAICLGDSGGPLLCNGVLVGIASFGKAHCNKCPGVYTLLCKNKLDWIQYTMKSKIQ